MHTCINKPVPPRGAPTKKNKNPGYVQSTNQHTVALLICSAIDIVTNGNGSSDNNASFTPQVVSKVVRRSTQSSYSDMVV